MTILRFTLLAVLRLVVLLCVIPIAIISFHLSRDLEGVAAVAILFGGLIGGLLFLNVTFDLIDKYVGLQKPLDAPEHPIPHSVERNGRASQTWFGPP